MKNKQYPENYVFLTKRHQFKNGKTFKISELVWVVPDFQFLLKLLGNSITEKTPVIDIFDITEGKQELIGTLFHQILF